jgi:hypothetical protein
MRLERTWANWREQPLHIDKLGVTGSSPVPPIMNPLETAGFCIQ